MEEAKDLCPGPPEMANSQAARNRVTRKNQSDASVLQVSPISVRFGKESDE